MGRFADPIKNSWLDCLGVSSFLPSKIPRQRLNNCGSLWNSDCTRHREAFSRWGQWDGGSLLHAHQRPPPLHLQLWAESTHWLPFSSLALNMPQRDHKLISPPPKLQTPRRVFWLASKTLSFSCQSVTFSSCHYSCSSIWGQWVGWESSDSCIVWFICTRGFWVDNNCLQMAINRNLLKNVLMVIKRKAKHIMPLVTSNYGGGLLCIGFEWPDISTQPCQMRVSLDFHLLPLESFLKDGIWGGLTLVSSWCSGLGSASHPMQERDLTINSMWRCKGQKEEQTFTTKCHIPNLMWAAFIPFISAILNHPGKHSFYYYFF